MANVQQNHNPITIPNSGFTIDHSNTAFNVGVIDSDSGAIKIGDGVRLKYPLLDLLHMYIFEGKKLDTHKREYLDLILKVTGNDNIKAMASFNRFKKWVEKNK